MEAIDDMNENGKAGFLDRTLNNLRNAWQAFRRFGLRRIDVEARPFRGGHGGAFEADARLP